MVESLATFDHSSTVILILQFCKQRKYMGVMGVANSFYGIKVILNGNLPEIDEYKKKMKSAAIQLTQGVSQVSMHSSMSLSDDLLKTKRMMIENLIESSELCHVPNGVEWYFRSCTNCASLVTIFEVKLCCKKCSTCKSDVPMYIHHLIFKGMKILVTDEEETTVMRYIDVAINCNEVEETTNHLFLHCTKTWKVWSKIQIWLDVNCIIPANLFVHWRC
ncbi:hypothetical protein MtrunA17_Chr3g0112231 [Medicago truncatula]|uniref:Reverse transcriptase zinc-binding domain-containing protein n=1 Tax=Medicago truncatula TaxID=3880 RepID=A0A396IV09_MEDTR|nr:uncharacterized protein LOC25489343 [Medicago truncatula]XP_024633526.1 uncharacterized protein LOC25489343 [Medicago truncatula]XP_024633529.1 uncharacterized protein LOC25489343 [Medicago truncatula]RHN68283.1 hypothetical protein MtrunA17_Chr3g0112231 [Medicago truncatula]